MTMKTTKLLSIPEFAKATGLSVWLARELVHRGDVPSVRVGARRRVDSRWVERWLAAGNPESDVPSPVVPCL
jgi:excisionase family DNA binding protein